MFIQLINGFLINFVKNDVDLLRDQIEHNIKNINPIESRLWSIREKLLRFEEDPKLIANGYKPFVPKDSKESDDEDNESILSASDIIEREQCLIEQSPKQLNFDQSDTIDSDPITNSEEKDASFDILATVKKEKIYNEIKKSASKKHKIDVNKIKNPMVSRAFAICDRWINDEPDQTKQKSSNEDQSFAETTLDDSFNLMSTIKKKNQR